MPARWFLLALLVATAPAIPTAAQTPSGSTIPLYAHWPSDLATAMEEPIPLTPLTPTGEEDLSAGPATPGSSTAGTVASFTYTMVNPDGSAGPWGNVSLDPSRPVELVVYLSADQTAWPSTAGDPPRDVDHGVAPRIAVDAVLVMGGERVSRDRVTHDLVSAPAPVGTPVQAYHLELPFDRKVLERGAGLEVTFAIRQVSVEGEQATQPFWNVHTGETYPTGVAVPNEPRPLDERDDDLASLSVPRAETKQARTVALGVLVSSVAVAALAGARLVSRLRD